MFMPHLSILLTKMYLAVRKPCPLATLFDVPHRSEPMTAYEIKKNFPAFAKEMDGGYEENTLSFFYKKNKETGVYEFKDEEAEEEVAELMGVELYDEEKEKKVEELPENRVLTEEEKEAFREHLTDIREKLKYMNDED